MSKKYKILIAILIIYIVLMILIFGFGVFKNETYIMIGTEEKLKYSHGKYEDIKIKENNLYQGEKFDVYNDSKLEGKYILKYHNDKWHAFKDDYQFVKITQPIFAIKTNKKYSVPKYQETNLNNSDLKILDGILTQEKVYNYNLSNNQKVIIDLDGDGKKEKLYIVSNLFEDESANKYFSLVYYIKDGKINILKKQIGNANKKFDLKYYYLEQLIDLNDDDKIEIIITEDCYSNVCEICSEIFSLKYGKYKSLRSCE